MNNAYSRFSTLRTPQSEPIPGESQIQNAAGGYVYDVGIFKQLERFLILGSEGGSYYVKEQKLTKDNALNAIKAIEQDGRRAVDVIVRISGEGRAPKNDAAIFVLALAASATDEKTRSYALANVSKVCRIPTHLFHFLTYVKQFRGFGRGLKRAIGDWYNNQDIDRLAYEVVKYQSRDGWSNADALRLGHPKANDGIRNLLYKWMVDGIEPLDKERIDQNLPQIVIAFEAAKGNEKNQGYLVGLIKKFNLSREMLPTEALKSPEVWEALLEKMPLTAMIRNLGNMSKCGLLKPLSDAAVTVVSKLCDREALKKARVHPVTILLALKTYAQGHGMLGTGTWDPVSSVVDALNSAFYAAFDYVEPTGKRLLLGIDVSSSMSAGIANIPMSAAEGAAVMALAVARVEPNYEIVCFNSKVCKQPKITKSMSLQEVQREVHGNGSTDCSATMRWATSKQVFTDCFVILTDSETWAGRYGHPSQVMREYRKKVNQHAKIVEVGMVATNCSINDPNDLGALSVAGFDASVPNIISEFIRS